MHALRTAILQHTTPTGVHHDWLIEDPTLPNPKSPDTRLWTARVAPPPQDWVKLRRFGLTAIPPHRRAYLTYQGDISGNRGHVIRRAEGTCFANLWTDQRIELTMHTMHLQVSLQLTRQSDAHWLACVDSSDGKPPC